MSENSNEAWTIVDAYLHDEMTSEMELQLVEWLKADRENVRYFVRATHQHKMLRDMLLVRMSDPFIFQNHLQIPPPKHQSELPMPPPSPRLLGRNKGRQSSPKRWLALAASLIFLLCGSFYFLKNSGQAQATGIAQVIDVQSKVSISRDQKEIQVISGTAILEGDTLIVSSGASISLRYPDRTLIKLKSDTTVTLHSYGSSKTDSNSLTGKSIILMQGELQANVTPQSSKLPMKISTSMAEVTVLGTKFSLFSNSKFVRLGVEEGKVRFTKSKDPKSLDVVGGQTVFVKDGIPFVAQSRKSLPLYTWTREEVDEHLQSLSVKLGKNTTFIGLDLIHTQFNAYGELPLELKQPGLDPNNLQNYDLSKVNPAYFDHLDYIILKSNSVDFPVTLHLSPALMSLVKSSEPEALQKFGDQLRTRFKGKKILYSMAPKSSEAEILLKALGSKKNNYPVER